MWIIKICTKVLAVEHFEKAAANFGMTLLFVQVVLLSNIGISYDDHDQYNGEQSSLKYYLI